MTSQQPLFTNVRIGLKMASNRICFNAMECNDADKQGNPTELTYRRYRRCMEGDSDHTDPGSLPTLAASNPRCRFVVPRAELEFVTALGLPATRLIPANDGDAIRVSDTIAIHVLPSAHEILKVNERGEHHFLGFILKLGRFTLYHSGDCVVYDGLAERLRPWRIDLALLPVNGRHAPLKSRGIMGNMTCDEARNLCLAAGIGTMLPHHFGMFAFNTIDLAELQRQATRFDLGVRCLMPSLDRHFLMETDGRELSS